MASVNIESLRETALKIKKEIEKTVIGQSDMVDTLLMGLFSKGHILLEGVPGLAKSLAVEALAGAIIGEIKFVDERLDLTGANVLVVDEIHRISPRIRKALLKAMQERQIVKNGEVFYLNQPLIVVATCNPSEGEKLTAAEADRFMVSYPVAFPSREQEIQVLKIMKIVTDVRYTPVTDCREILKIQKSVEKIPLAEEQYEIIAGIADRSRNPLKYKIKHAGEIFQGISTRAAMYIVILAKASAFMNGSFEPSSEDIVRAAELVLPHRIILRQESSAPVSEIVSSILKPF